MTMTVVTTVKTLRFFLKKIKKIMKKKIYKKLDRFKKNGQST